MPPAALHVDVLIDAPPEAIFPYLADLTRHGEWSSDPVHIVPLTEGTPGLGSRYQSVAQSHGATFRTELVVTRCEPPSAFGFEGADATGRFRHLFTLTPRGRGTLVRREMHFNATLPQWIVFCLVLYPVRIPSAKRTLGLLKQYVESAPQRREP